MCAIASAHHYCVLNLFCVVFVQMFDVHHAPGDISDAGTSPVAAAYSVVAAGIHSRRCCLAQHRQVMDGPPLFVENCRKTKKKRRTRNVNLRAFAFPTSIYSIFKWASHALMRFENDLQEYYYQKKKTNNIYETASQKKNDTRIRSSFTTQAFENIFIEW